MPHWSRSAATALSRALHTCGALHVDLRGGARGAMLLPTLEAALGDAKLTQLEHRWARNAAEARTQQELAQAGLERSQLFACTRAEVRAGMEHPETLPATVVDGPETGDRFLGWLPPSSSPPDYLFFFGPPSDPPTREPEPLVASSLADLDYPYGVPDARAAGAGADGAAQ
jgi:hypothetical protein